VSRGICFFTGKKLETIFLKEGGVFMGDRNFFRRVFLGGAAEDFFWIDFFLECFF
jgi:hypothetical protein